MHIGVIGAGLMGSTHVRIVNAAVSGAHVVAVSDPVAENALRVASEAGVPTIYADARELIRDPEVEAVIIASPAHTHEDFTLACLREGKPVLCEKPLAASADACRRVLDAESALGRRLVQVGFMRRYDPGYVDLKQRLDDGAVGEPLIVHCAHRNAVAPATFTSEMVITDSVVHEIDTVRWLLGEEIARATVFTLRASGLQDPQVVIFEMESGRIVEVECFVNAQYGYDIRCEVVAETGTLELAAPATVAARHAGGHALDVPDGFQQRFGTAYLHELQSWVAGRGEPAGPDAWDGYAAAAVCEACVESLHTRRPVEVELAPRPGLYAHAHDLVAR
jgi:myo-inositol 2-dehydrogenase/D-chiro-inositol 1-dehydrogenase